MLLCFHSNRMIQTIVVATCLKKKMLEIALPAKNGLNKTIANNNNYREQLKKETQDRRRAILHLIFKYLVENNFNASAETLQNETQTGLYYETCDNVDLDIILQEYQSYYHAKFQKNPKILRKLEVEVTPIKKPTKKEKTKTEPILQPVEKKSEEFQFEIANLSQTPSPVQSSTKIGTNSKKSLIDYDNYSSEWREMADQITKQILPKNQPISFDDCISLDETIERLKEAIIYPLTYPQLFANVRSWRGILLYGPPGTGKTLLAKALASESTSTVINVTSSAFISKWRGESEKLVKVLFDVAKIYAPTTIFIDEIDALAATSQEHEASKRFKSELLIQIDGVVQSEDIFVLATSNSPWGIDSALLRRFEKRILVPLPNEQARGEIFNYYFKKQNHQFAKDEIRLFVKHSEHFSGSDLKNVCKEVQMILIRYKLNELKMGAKKVTQRQATCNDVLDALERIKPASNRSKIYLEWGANHGAL